MTKYKHIFFDLDRTLWDFDKNSHMALEEIFQLYKLEEQGISDSAKFISVYKEINEQLWDRYRKGFISKKSLRNSRFSRTLKHFGCNNSKLGRNLGDAYIEISPHKTAILPNCVPVLEYLASRYKLHIITNGFEEVQHIKMSKSGIADFFSVVVTSERAGARKPDPFVFHYAMKLSEATISDSIMIGDDLTSDVGGARGVFMDSVFFNPLGIEHDEEPTHEIKDLIELKSIL